MINGSSMKYVRIRSLISIMALMAMVVLAVRMAGQVPKGVVEEKGAAYGEYIGWDEVNKIFRRREKAVIIDLDSGRSFSVVRLGGSLHADVEPLTAADAAEMKSICGGHWSWKRRAALLTVGERTLACSINSMPHGPGRIRDNNFSGHFCVHFRDSRLHVSRREDPAHRLMVAKAAGMVDELLAESGPVEVINIFFTALDQSELGILARVTRFENPAQLAELLSVAQTVDRVGLYRTDLKNGSVDVEVSIKYKKDAKSYAKRGSININNNSILGWRLEYSSVKALLAPGGEEVPKTVINEDYEKI